MFILVTMIPIIFSLVFGYVELATGIAMYILFLYEETCQFGNMAQFIDSMQGGGKGKMIGSYTRQHGLNPGQEALAELGWLIPWAEEAYSFFFWSVEYAIMAYS